MIGRIKEMVVGVKMKLNENLSHKSLSCTQPEMLKVVTDSSGVGRKGELFKPEFQVYHERTNTPSPRLSLDVTYNFKLSSA